MQRERETELERERAEIFMINDFTGQCRASALSPWGVSGLSQCARRSKLTAPRWVVSEYYLNVGAHTFDICYIYCIVHTLLRWYCFGPHWHGKCWQTRVNAVWFLLCLSYVHIEIIPRPKYQRKMQLKLYTVGWLVSWRQSTSLDLLHPLKTYLHYDQEIKKFVTALSQTPRLLNSVKNVVGDYGPKNHTGFAGDSLPTLGSIDYTIPFTPTSPVLLLREEQLVVQLHTIKFKMHLRPLWRLAEHILNHQVAEPSTPI